VFAEKMLKLAWKGKHASKANARKLIATLTSNARKRQKPADVTRMYVSAVR
jgi:hypothetical protein